MTGSMDETYEETYVPPVLGANISVVGTAANNSSNRELIMDGDTIYSDNGGSGLRMVVFTEASIDNYVNQKLVANADTPTLSAKFDETYTLDSDASRTDMATKILGGDWAMNDIFTVTSYHSVQYNDLLKNYFHLYKIIY